jgi:glutathione S-transferase
VPYLIDGDFKLTDPTAINLFIIKRSSKTELLGRTLEDEAAVQCLLSVLGYAKEKLVNLFFDKEHECKLGGVI